MSFKISRFIHIDKYRKSDNTLKPRLFKPDSNKVTNRLEVSCYTLDGLDFAEIKSIANLIISNHKPPIGHCTANSIEFPQKVLTVTIEEDEFIERHFNIIGWPTDQIDQDLIINSLISLFGNDIEIY